MSAPTLPDLADERFELVGVLGEGGMATVYKAIDRSNQTWCAVKVLHPRYVDKPKIRQRFAAEAQAMMRMKHRNVITVTAVRTDVLQPWFAMELAEGGCVVEWLAAHGPMPPKMAVDVVIQVCKGLGAAHRQGVVHRDVKPHNLLVTRRAVCKITDFGIAQIEEDGVNLTRTGSVMGTLGYIAPEQRANAKDVDERSDVYSVGATLFTMLTGRTTMDLFFADQDTGMLEGVHEALVPVILRATRYRREERHASVRDLAKDLYRAKALLPDDPPETPSLVLHVEPEPPDEYDAGLAEITSETPLSDLVTPSTPARTGASDPPLEPPANLGLSSTPGIPRAQLLRETEDPAWGQTVATLVRIAVLLFLIAIVSAVGITSVAASGRGAVLAYTQVYQDAQVGLETVLGEETTLVSDLTALGAPPAELERLWSAWQGAQGRDREKRVRELVIACRELLRQHEPEPGSSRVHLARKADSGLDRIESALAKVEEASATVDAVRASLGGRTATALGLVSAP